MILSTQLTARRVLGFPVLCALVTGNMIGSGIFLLPAALAPFGGISLISWFITSLGAMVLAYIFANLSTYMPKEGGPYAFCREAFGDFIGFQVAYNYWIAMVIANAATLVAMVAAATVFFPALTYSPHLSLCLALAALWLITAINLIGVGQAGAIQLWLTVLKVLPLIGLVILGFSDIHWEYFTIDRVKFPAGSMWSGVAMAASLTLWAFTGLESATIPAAYSKDPNHTIPRATLIGTLLTALIYVSATVIVMGLIPPDTLSHSNAPFSEVAQLLLGSIGAKIVAGVAALSCFAATVGWILLQAQVPLAAAQDGLFPRVFAMIDKNGTPVIGLIISSILASILLVLNYQQSFVDQFTLLVKCSTLAFLIPYLFTMAAKLVLLARHPQRFPYAYKSVTVMLALVGYGYVFWAIFGLGQELIYYGALLFFTGIPLYTWIKLRQAPKHSLVEVDP